LTIVRRLLGTKTIKSSETSHHIDRNLVGSFQRIGRKYCSKDPNSSRRVFSQSIIINIIRKNCFLQQTSHLMKCNIKTLRNYSNRLDILYTNGCPTDLWAFNGRIPHFNMNLIQQIEELLQDLWHANTRPSSNQKDVLKIRRGSRDYEPHIKHFLCITQPQLYERFMIVHSELNLGQIYFHKCKPSSNKHNL
jgi:hypothetical protein